MIIYALIILTILFFVAWNLWVTNPKLHIVTSVISTMFLLLAIIFSISNFSHHYGMHLVNSHHTEKLASVTKTSPMLIYEKLGSVKKNQIVIYRHTDNGKKLHTIPDTSIKNKIIRTNAKRPYIKVTHRNWEYRSNVMRDWFGLAQKRSHYKTINYFYVPKTWHALSIHQVRVLRKIIKRDGQQSKKQLASPQAKALMKQKAQTYVKAHLMRSMKKDPHMSEAKQRILTKRIVNQFKSRSRLQATDKIMSKALNQAQSAPESYSN